MESRKRRGVEGAARFGLAVVAGCASGTKHVKGIGRRAIARLTGCHHHVFANAAVASQKLDRAPCRPIKASGLTWASALAAWSRQQRGSSELGSSSAGRPPSHCLFEQLFVIHPAERAAGQSKPARSGAVTHGSIAGSFVAKVPKMALFCRFLGGVRPWLASVRRCSSTARRGGGFVQRHGGGRAAP